MLGPLHWSPGAGISKRGGVSRGSPGLGACGRARPDSPVPSLQGSWLEERPCETFPGQDRLQCPVTFANCRKQLLAVSFEGKRSLWAAHTAPGGAAGAGAGGSVCPAGRGHSPGNVCPPFPRVLVRKQKRKVQCSRTTAHLLSQVSEAGSLSPPGPAGVPAQPRSPVGQLCGCLFPSRRTPAPGRTPAASADAARREISGPTSVVLPTESDVQAPLAESAALTPMGDPRFSPEEFSEH